MGVGARYEGEGEGCGAIAAPPSGLAGGGGK